MIINPIVEFIGTFVFLSVILLSGHAIPIGVALVGMIYFAKGTQKNTSLKEPTNPKNCTQKRLRTKSYFS